jgi:hypothetical protein
MTKSIEILTSFPLESIFIDRIWFPEGSFVMTEWGVSLRGEPRAKNKIITHSKRHQIQLSSFCDLGGAQQTRWWPRQMKPGDKRKRTTFLKESG